jgi:hypothetical protein
LFTHVRLERTLIRIDMRLNERHSPVMATTQRMRGNLTHQNHATRARLRCKAESKWCARTTVQRMSAKAEVVVLWSGGSDRTGLSGVGHAGPGAVEPRCSARSVRASDERGVGPARATGDLEYMELDLLVKARDLGHPADYRCAASTTGYCPSKQASCGRRWRRVTHWAG